VVSRTDLDDAVRAFHAEHAPALLGWARRHSADPSQADEIVQETLVLAWRKQHLYDPSRGSERAWLFGIARNVAVDQHRRRHRHLRSVPTADLPEGTDDSAIERAVETSHVRDALATLSDAHRQVLVETYYRGHTVREAAARIGVPEGTVKSRLHHAMRALRTELERVEVLG
jgi:RNA polymerase sigma-70 factor, ECF subfamily